MTCQKVGGSVSSNWQGGPPNFVAVTLWVETTVCLPTIFIKICEKKI